MKTLASVACGTLLTMAAPALAQHTPSEFESVSLAIYGPCSRGTFVDLAAAAATATACGKLIADLDIVMQAADGNVAGHDLNIFHALKATGSLRVSRAYAIQDNNTRTARVCATAEQAWSYAAKVDLAKSPLEYEKLLQPMLAEVADLARLCRGEFAPPADAAPLPAA